MEGYDCEDFLEVVYGEREGWIDLPAKVSGYWIPFHTEWPADETVSRRIDSSLRDREDLYYSVAQFSERGRAIENVLPTPWLWADLDEVHPSEAGRIGYLPTLAVQSSPGRYQALWRLDRELSGKAAEKLNRALSYALGADKGGWDLTQVLRPPGTRNFKYPGGPVVKWLWHHEELIYRPAYLWKALRKVVPESELGLIGRDIELARRPLSARAKALLRTRADEVVEGERSDRIWELECLLAEAGLTQAEIVELVWESAWNKWRDVRTGRTRVEREVAKAVAKVRRSAALKEKPREREPEPSKERVGSTKAAAADEAGEKLPFVGYSSFLAMRMEEPRWLVKDMWTAGSHGIIGGEPKTSKTTLALALALAVASGRPFLGKYPVGVTGPVLFVQEENAPWVMQDRLRKLAGLMGLVSKSEAVVRQARRSDLARKGKVVVELEMPSDVPLRMLNNWGLDLGLEEHRDMLVGTVDEIRPRMVVLDPLYLLLGDVDTDKVYELRPVLKWLLNLRYEYDCAVVLVHHMRKKAAGASGTSLGGPRPGQNLMGSAILHGWVDSAIYCNYRMMDSVGWTGTLMEREFRSMAPQKPIEVDWNMGEVGSLEMEVAIRGFDLEGLIEKHVLREPGISVNQLAETLDMDRRTLLARVRGGEMQVKVSSGRQGRGMTHRLFPADSNGSGDQGDD